MGTPYLGEIKMIPFNFPPKTWAFCDGQQMPINQNQALFSLFGTMYGGNGQTTFALPDLRGRIPMHIGAGFTQGERGGEVAHTLSISEMPTHTHQAQGTSSQGGSFSPDSNIWSSVTGVTPYSTSTSGLQGMLGTAVGLAGGSQPHDNMPPYIVINFCVALVGAFPSRN